MKTIDQVIEAVKERGVPVPDISEEMKAFLDVIYVQGKVDCLREAADAMGAEI